MINGSGRMNGKKIIAFILIAALVFLIICPLLSIFAEAVFQDGRFSFSSAITAITESENAKMIGSSLLLGILVVIVSSAIALPLAYIFSRTSLARYHFFDIIFMMTAGGPAGSSTTMPIYIYNMGWTGRMVGRASAASILLLLFLVLLCILYFSVIRHWEKEEK